VGRGTGGVRQYARDGTIISSFTSPSLGDPIDIKVGPENLLYVGTQTTSSVREFDLAGHSIRTFGGMSYPSVAVLPGGLLWAGEPNFTRSVAIFSITTGTQIGIVSLDGGQNRASSMFYSKATGTVLMTDGSLAAIGENTIFERDLNGALVRTFSSSEFRNGTGNPSFGVTRGPNGDVFATTAGGGGKVYQWHEDGTFVRSFSLPEVDGLPVAGGHETSLSPDPRRNQRFLGSWATSAENNPLVSKLAASGMIRDFDFGMGIGMRSGPPQRIFRLFLEESLKPRFSGC
jgi:hypothetical protein